jgi:hypothetical protein
MKKVYKYPLDANIKAPQGAKPLCVQVQHGDAFVWMQVDPAKPDVTHKFLIVGTGAAMPEDEWLKEYLGTFQLNGGNYIGHVFYCFSSDTYMLSGRPVVN